jgi:hypothetical protein
MCSTRAGVNTQKTTTGFNTPFIYILIFDGTYANTYTNGIIQTPPNIAHSGTFAYTEYKIGTRAGSTGNVFWTGYIGEILVYNSALTTTQRQTVEGYLAWKWGLQVQTITTPLSISTCVLWLDAADATTITGTTTVTAWRDKSTKAYTLAPGSGTTSYANSAITLSSSYLLATGAVDLTTFTFFVVVKNNNTSTNIPLFAARPNTSASYNSTDGFGFYLDGQTQTRFYGSTSGPVITTTGLTTSAATLISVTGTSAGVLQQWNNGIAGGTVTYGPRTSTAQGFSVGGEWGGSSYTTYSSSSSIYEVIVYNSVLSTTQRQSVENYLSKKWVKPSLPTTHPFYSLPAFSRPFGPTDIPGCAVWLDAADATTITGTTTVTAWKDKSPSGYTMVNQVGTSSLSTNALNGMNAIYVPNTAIMKITNFAWRTKFTLFVVGKCAFGSMLLGGNGSGFVFTGNYALLTRENVSGNGVSIQDSVNALGVSVVTPNTWFIFCIGYNNVNNATASPYKVNGTDRFTRVDTSFPGSTTVVDVVQTNNFYINSTNGLSTNTYDSDYVAELIIYNDNLTNRQAQQVEGYLAAKWGLLSSVVSGHPFKSIPPSTSQPPQFQEVTPGNWTRDWQPYLQRLAAANSSGVTVTTSNLTGGGTYTANGWFGCVLGPDGNIYFGPATATTILKLTVSTGVTTNITGGASYTGGFSGGVLGPDGNIYFGPGSGSNILKLNVATGVTTNITGGASYTGGWEGGALGHDGNIYFSPVSATNILKLNVSSGVTTNITGGATYTTGWRGAVLAPNGNIYFTPCGATNILVLNVATGQTSNITGGASYTGSWRGGGVIGPDGNIYFPPYGANNILKLNLATGVTTNIGTTAGNSIGGILAPNGNIYFGPFSTGGSIYVLNTSTGTVSSITGSATYTDIGWCGGVLCTDGNIYFSPYAANNVLKLTLSGLKQLPSSNYCLSAWANKL